MKKIFILSTIASVLSLAHSVNTYTEYNYNGESKAALGSNLKLEFKNISGESKLKFGEFTLNESVFKNFHQNIEFKNEYNLRLNAAKNLDLVGKVKFDVEKKETTDKVTYEIEPLVEYTYKDFKLLAGLNEKGTKETFDTGIRLGVDYAKSGFENKFRLGAWYLTKSVSNEEINSEKYNNILKGVTFEYTSLKLAEKGKDGYSEKKTFIPFELSVVDNINYSKGKFGTKNEINVNYVNKDTFVKVSKSGEIDSKKQENLFVYNEHYKSNTLTFKLKSENSYNVTDTITAKLNLENELKIDASGNVYDVKINKDVVKYNNDIKYLTNKTTVKGALNYTKQIDSKNKFVVEPSLKFEGTYTTRNIVLEKELVKGEMEIKNKENKTSINEFNYNLIPRIEATYENKVTDKFTFALKPFIELKFSSDNVLSRKATYIITENKKGDYAKVIEDNMPSGIEEKQKTEVKANKEIKLYDLPANYSKLSYSNVSAGAKLEFNYAW